MLMMQFICRCRNRHALDANNKTQALIGRSLSEIQTMHESDLHPKEEAENTGHISKTSLEGIGLQEEL